MKLLFCPHCQNLFKLTKYRTYCACSKSWGYYLDDINALMGGSAIPIGISNSSFAEAIRRQPDVGPGYKFEAFVIERNCPTIERKED